MTKLIAALIIVAVCYGVWELFLYWEKVKNEEDVKKAQNVQVIGDQLPGVNYELEKSLQEARSKGTAALGAWLKAHGQSIEDPRKAWLELDYCVAIARENPAEARRIFAEVKERIGPNSPVYSRVQQLAKTYQ